MKPLYFQGIGNFDDGVIRHMLAEFVANGVTNIGLSSGWCNEILKDAEYLDRMMRHAEKYGVNYSGAHGPWGPQWDITETDESCRHTMIEGHCRLLEMLGDIGVKTYTVHPHAGFDANKRQDELMRNNAIAALEKMLPYAEKHGIVIAVENNFTPPCAGERIADLCRYFDSPWIGANYDTGHAHILDPAPGKKFADIDPIDDWKLYPQEFQQHQLETMLPYIVTCHIHDNDGLFDSHLLPGEGNIDWAYVMGSLAKAPRMIEYQSEVSIINGGRAIRKVVGTFSEEFMTLGKLR